jgi:hypothetical protein
MAFQKSVLLNSLKGCFQQFYYSGDTFIDNEDNNLGVPRGTNLEPF